jgi:hypothetical protein
VWIENSKKGMPIEVDERAKTMQSSYVLSKDVVQVIINTILSKEGSTLL